jgi:hypothetical protein
MSRRVDFIRNAMCSQWMEDRERRLKKEKKDNLVLC